MMERLKSLKDREKHRDMVREACCNRLFTLLKTRATEEKEAQIFTLQKVTKAINRDTLPNDRKTTTPETTTKAGSNSDNVK